MKSRKTHTKTCEYCNKAFEAGRSYIRFCSHSCSSIFNKIKRYGHKIKKDPTACEKCGKIPDEIYATGRFCSKKCSRGFSTSHARKEISEKTRNTLKLKTYQPHFKRVAWEASGKKNTCKFCNQFFEVIWSKRNRVYCSDNCIKSFLSVKMMQRNVAGNFYQSFGRRIEYTERGLKIRCDSLIEWCAIEHVYQIFGDSISSINRSSLQIPYEINGKKRMYNPDFEIKLKNGNKYIIECKSEQSGKSPIWIRYHEESVKKKKILEDYCNSHGMTSIWFTQKTRKDLYMKIQRMMRQHSEEINNVGTANRI